jgi:N-acetylneuraminic acid mutarotase
VVKLSALGLCGAPLLALCVFACGGLLGLEDRTGSGALDGAADTADADGADAATDVAPGTDAGRTDASDTWVMLAPMANARTFPASAAVNGKGYVVGGIFAGFSASYALEAYEPLGDAWATGSPNQAPLWAASTAVLRDTIYFFGGIAGTGTGTGTATAVRAYAPSTQRWSSAPDLPAPRAFTSAAVLGGKAYVFGGETATGASNTVSAESFVYDPSVAAWSTGAAMPTARSRASSATASGAAYVMGGIAILPKTLATVERYDPATDQWTARAPMPTPRYDATCAAVNGILYVIGGHTSLDLRVATVEAYDPVTDQWTRKADMPTPRAELTSFVIDNRIYVAGGRFGLTDLATLEVYTP